MNRAMKTKLFIICCLVLLLTGLFASQPAFGLTGNGDFLMVVSYPLWQESSGASGSFHQQLQIYINDLHTAGWNVKVLMVSTNYFTVPGNLFNNVVTSSLVYNSTTPDWIELKNAIKNTLPNCTAATTNGFVLIGSAPHIPTVYWRYREREVNGTVGECHPTDLYYADKGDWEVWSLANQSLAPDQPGIQGIVYTFKDANGNLKSGIDSYEPMPELIYGRISGREVCTATTDPSRLAEEASKIADYLARIHNYRVNGSPLTTQERNTAIMYTEDDFTGIQERTGYFQGGELAGRVYEYQDLTVTNRDNFKKALERGSQFCFITSHAGPSSFSLLEWPETNYQRYEYFFEMLNNSNFNPKSHFYYIFGCSACRFTTPNMGANLLFNNNFTYTVIGKTSPDNVYAGNDMFPQLNEGETVGRAFYNDAYYIHDHFHGEGSCLFLSSHTLLGDPALTYPQHIANHPPMIMSSLVSLEAPVNKPFSLPLTIFNRETETQNEGVTITVEPIYQPSLPGNMQYNATELTWTPTVADAGKTYYFRITATDDAQNMVQQEFTIYVNHFEQPFFEKADDDGKWRMRTGAAGGVLTYITDYLPNTNPPQANPFWFFRRLNRRTNYSIRFTNDYDSLSQSIAVQPGTYYNLGFYILNKTDRSQLTVRIPQLNYVYPVSKGLVNPEYVCIPVYSADKTSVEVFIDIGDSSHLVNGELAISNIKLMDTRQSGMVYLSDLDYVSQVGMFQMDRSRFGSTQSLNGETFTKGIGTLSGSTITYRLAKQFQRFTAYIGIDDIIGETAPNHVVFEVRADGQLIYQSVPLYPNSPIQFINLDIAGKDLLELRVTGNNDPFDCADWANAKLTLVPGDLEHGLSAEYYQDKELLRLTGKKIDSQINFAWGSTSPGFGLAADNYSIRWTGKVKADYNGIYTFKTFADDGVRLWVNGQLIINYWFPNGWNQQDGYITLVAGKYYDIKLEYFENTGNASAQLMWSCSGLPLQTIPTSNLFVR